MNLLIFTDSYPYAASKEDPFIGRELPYLAETFDRIILFPKKCVGVRNRVIEGIEVDQSFSKYLNNKFNLLVVLKKFRSLNLIFQELRSKPLLVFSFAKLLRLILFYIRTIITKLWAEEWLEKHGTLDGITILYSYWFTETTTGLGLVKDKYPDLRLISRAHGYDVYEDQYFPYYWPLRRRTLTYLDKLFLASEDANKYFQNRYPEFYELFETAHLGVNDPGFTSKQS